MPAGRHMHVSEQLFFNEVQKESDLSCNRYHHPQQAQEAHTLHCKCFVSRAMHTQGFRISMVWSAFNCRPWQVRQG
eukprot:257937-Chlamydomonas_euryale.AAC.9